MNKKLLLLLIVFMMIPMRVLAADECDPSSVKIENVEVNDTRGNIEENSNPTSDNNELNLDLNMNVPGDSIEYKLTLKNTSEEDYYFDENSLVKNMDNVEYEFSYSDGDNIVKSGEEKIVILKVTYKDKVAASQLDNGVMSQNNTVTLNLTNRNINIPDTLRNANIAIIIFVSLVIIAGLLMILKERKASVLVLLIGVSISLIPLTVHALCKCELNVNSKIEIDGKEAIFLPGDEVNIKMKQLAGDDTSQSRIGTKNYTIKSIIHSDVEPTDSNKEEKNIVSTDESTYPIYMWYDNEAIYWWSEDKTPSLNEEGGYVFVYMFELNNIEGISDFDLSNTTELTFMFFGDALTNVDALEKWNVENVTNLNGLLYRNKKITDVSGIKKWNVKKVTSLENVFASCYMLEEIDLSNWETDSLISMFSTFGMWNDNGRPTLEGTLKRIILSDKFDTSKVTNMQGLFANNDEIEDYSFLKYIDVSSNTIGYTMFQNNSNFTTDDLVYLKNWDTSKFESFQYMFFADKKINSLELLKDWKTSNVVYAGYMFHGLTNLENLNGLEKWDMSEVTDINYMFYNTGITDLSPIKDWNTSSVEKMDHIFGSYSANPGLTSLLPLKKWNVSNVKTMGGIFNNRTGITSLSGLEDWNVSNVVKRSEGSETDNLAFKNAFSNMTALEDASAIDDWEINSSADFTDMFKNTPVHPEFSKVSGSWNDGTFIPE